MACLIKIRLLKFLCSLVLELKGKKQKLILHIIHICWKIWFNIAFIKLNLSCLLCYIAVYWWWPCWMALKLPCVCRRLCTGIDFILKRGFKLVQPGCRAGPYSQILCFWSSSLSSFSLHWEEHHLVPLRVLSCCTGGIDTWHQPTEVKTDSFPILAGEWMHKARLHLLGLFWKILWTFNSYWNNVASM